MTHDELLADINKYCSDIESGLRWEPDCYIKALRAVVEWHKPNPIPDWVPTEEKLMCWCAHIYPCPTIKAIEKELSNAV
jgi:hypothetical protein